MSVNLGLGVNVLVSPSLHPQNVASLEDYDSETEGELAQVVDAFKHAYEDVGRCHAARQAAAADPSMTEAAAVLRTAEHADKVLQSATARFDRASKNMKAGIDLIEKELNAPVIARASHVISTEVRAHCKGLTTGQRMGFVTAAIDRGDADTVSAILGAPSYLSGITDDMKGALLRMWNSKTNPGAVKRQRAMQAALDLLDRNAPLIFGQLEKAVGKKPHEVRAYREAKARADKAFAV